MSRYLNREIGSVAARENGSTIAVQVPANVNPKPLWHLLTKHTTADAGMTLGAVLAGRWAAGGTFGTVLWAGFVIPLLAGGNGRRGLSAGWQTVAVLAVSLAGCLGLLHLTSGIGWLTTCIVVSACALAVGLGSGGAAAAASRLAWCVWFAAPCWIDGGWTSLAVGRLVAIQPALVLNGLWRDTGDWSHQALAYRWLTRLGQDVAFELPNQIWPCVAVHAGLAASVLIAGRWTRRTRGLAAVG